MVGTADNTGKADREVTKAAQIHDGSFVRVYSAEDVFYGIYQYTQAEKRFTLIKCSCHSKTEQTKEMKMKIIAGTTDFTIEEMTAVASANSMESTRDIRDCWMRYSKQGIWD